MSWQVPTILALVLFLFDFQNVIAWWRGRIIDPSGDESDDYTLLVPVYGHPRYFAERAHLLHEQPRTLVIVDLGGPGMADFADDLESEGWRVARVELDRPSPPALIKAVLDRVTTGFVARLDADTRPRESLSRYVAAMAKDGTDICSVKVAVSSPATQPQKFQDLEYRMAMLSRHFRPWLTSGACFIARRDSLARINERHSMWFPGEDIETGRVAHALRMRVRHCDLVVETDAPSSWRQLYMQRRQWWAGNFRHTVVNMDKNALHMPVWTLYYVGLVYVGCAIKWDGVREYLNPIDLIIALSSLFSIYAIVTLIANWQVRSWRMLIFPPYALVQAMLMPTVGTVRYFRIARQSGYAGRYRFGYLRGRA